jgi:hypothetical protein
MMSWRIILAFETPKCLTSGCSFVSEGESNRRMTRVPEVRESWARSSGVASCRLAGTSVRAIGRTIGRRHGARFTLAEAAASSPRVCHAVSPSPTWLRPTLLGQSPLVLAMRCDGQRSARRSSRRRWTRAWATCRELTVQASPHEHGGRWPSPAGGQHSGQSGAKKYPGVAAANSSSQGGASPSGSQGLVARLQASWFRHSCV